MILSSQRNLDWKSPVLEFKTMQNDRLVRQITEAKRRRALEIIQPDPQQKKRLLTFKEFVSSKAPKID